MAKDGLLVYYYVHLDVLVPEMNENLCEIATLFVSLQSNA